MNEEVFMIDVYKIKIKQPIVRRVDKSSEGYQNMKTYMAQHGFLEAYPVTITTGHFLLDGLSRLECAKELKIKEIPCIVWHP